ncbi:hypothetical protein [Halorussus lipolyticus]|uniref:hypothetical protein n=1 Tax=Halorussus lipolyticus TaxID=3034024 RepID=UPI0023E8E060|nr:hypothetical protein [Halorussus sp. DT80]
MVWQILALLALLLIVGVLSLRFVPKRWDRVDLKVGLSGLRLSAEDSPEDSS